MTLKMLGNLSFPPEQNFLLKAIISANILQRKKCKNPKRRYSRKIVVKNQGWEFTLSLIRSSLFRSKSLILKSDHERFAHVTLYKIRH